MTIHPNVRFEPEDVAMRLSELGLVADDLREPVQLGLADASNCTTHDPQILPSLTAWGKTVGYMRDRLTLSGWKPQREQGYEITVRPDERMGIAVAGGDSCTGRADVTPATRSEKGPATIRAIRANNKFRIIEMSELSDSFPRPELPPDMKTWILLYYFDADRQEIRLELSLPIGMDDNKQVNVWDERLILAPITDEGVDVTVRRKP